MSRNPPDRRPDPTASLAFMNDRVFGVFEDRPAAEEAMSTLDASEVAADRMTVKRVLAPTHRGFANSETVHSLIHAPQITEDDRTSEEAGTVILIVEMLEEPDEDSEDNPASVTGDLRYDSEEVMRRLDELGATETQLVPATPGLDL